MNLCRREQLRCSRLFEIRTGLETHTGLETRTAIENRDEQARPSYRRHR